MDNTIPPKPGQFTDQKAVKLKAGQTIDSYLEPYHFKAPYDPEMRYSSTSFECDYNTGYGKCEYKYLLLIINKKYFYVVALETRSTATRDIMRLNCKCTYCTSPWYTRLLLGDKNANCRLDKYKFDNWISTDLQQSINNTKQYLTRERKYICYEQKIE